MHPLRNLRTEVRYSGSPGIFLLNLFFQRILRVDGSFGFQKHYTSRVLHGHRLILLGDQAAARRSLAASGGCYINAGDGLLIGEGTIWAPNVSFLAQDHDPAELGRNRPTSGVQIGDNCWIGFGAVILPNVELGPRTVVGANSVVTSSFPEGNVVIAGAPAKVIRANERSE